MKKKIVFSLLAVFALIVTGCAKQAGPNVTPQQSTIQKIYFQKTVIDEKGNYTYKEKEIEDPSAIGKLCSAIEALPVEAEDPVKYSEVDYLIVFECGKRHKLMVLKNEIIYDGVAYRSVKGSLGEAIADLYDGLAAEEKETSSKLFA